MEFLLKCSTRYQTCALRSLVSYGAKHSKRNSISTRAHVVLSIYLDAEVSPCPEKGGGGGGGEEGVGVPVENGHGLSELEMFEVEILTNLLKKIDS